MGNCNTIGIASRPNSHKTRVCRPETSTSQDTVSRQRDFAGCFYPLNAPFNEETSMFEDLKARKALQQITPSLQALDQQLQQVDQVRDPIDRLVGFFDAVARFNDKQQEAPLSF